jgi:hypothetical protein
VAAQVEGMHLNQITLRPPGDARISARESGERVVIDGTLSACTLVVGMVPRDKVCATPKAVLGFPLGVAADGRWQAREPLDRQPGDARCVSRRVAQIQRGGLSSKMIFLYGREFAEIDPRGAREASGGQPAFKSAS